MFFQNFNVSFKLFVLLSIIFGGIFKTEAIFKGENALPGDFPFIVSLRNESGDHYCGGALVTKKHVVTAAHCTYDDNTVLYRGNPTKLKPHEIKVVVGTLSSEEGGDIHKVEKYHVHPDYNPRARNHMKSDIAVIVLKEEVGNTANVSSIALPATFPKDNASGAVAGWGYVNFQSLAADLQKMSVKIQNKITCEKEWKEVNTPWDATFASNTIAQIREDNNLLCALPVVNGSGACIRDSGSPLIVNNEFVGILSFGIPCGRGVSDLYTSVSGYQDFIKNIISS